MAQNRRERGRRYRGLFKDYPIASRLFEDEVKTDDHLARSHRLAKQGKASNTFLTRVANFFKDEDDAAAALGRYLRCIRR